MIQSKNVSHEMRLKCKKFLQHSAFVKESLFQEILY